MWTRTCSFPGREGVGGAGLSYDSLLLLSLSRRANNMCSLVAGLPFSIIRWRSLISAGGWAGVLWDRGPASPSWGCVEGGGVLLSQYTQVCGGKLRG